MAELNARGLRFYTVALGQGSPTVVFLHGLVMDNLSSWYFAAAPRVAAHRRALLYDLRGHGRSERPPSGYTVADHLADLDALLEAAGEREPVILVGNSFGGHLAAAFAVLHPSRVAGLALIDAHLGAAEWGEAMAATLSKQGEDRDHTIALLFKDWLGRSSQRKSTRLQQAASALVHGTTLVDDLRAAPPLTDPDLAALTCPVLALYGDGSDLVHEAARLRRLLPAADVRVLPGCSHSLMWEANEAVAQALVNFTAPGGPCGP